MTDVFTQALKVGVAGLEAAVIAVMIAVATQGGTRDALTPSLGSREG